MSPNSPLGDIAIRIAAVIGKAPNPSILRSINKLDRELVRKAGTQNLELDTPRLSATS